MGSIPMRLRQLVLPPPPVRADRSSNPPSRPPMTAVPSAFFLPLHGNCDPTCRRRASRPPSRPDAPRAKGDSAAARECGAIRRKTHEMDSMLQAASASEKGRARDLLRIQHVQCSKRADPRRTQRRRRKSSTGRRLQSSFPCTTPPRPWRPGRRADGDPALRRGHRNFLCLRGDAFPLMTIVRPSMQERTGKQQSAVETPHGCVAGMEPGPQRNRPAVDRHRHCDLRATHQCDPGYRRQSFHEDIRPEDPAGSAGIRLGRCRCASGARCLTPACAGLL